MATLSSDDLRRIMREGAGEAEGVNLNGDIFDSAFADLGYDSLAVLEIAVRIKREYGISLSDEAVMEAETPSRLLALANATAVGSGEVR